MEKKKILVFLRVSTDTQELDNQRAEMLDFVKSMRFEEGDCVFVEGIGASAIKINDEYVAMYNEVKKYIEKKEICAVAVWSLSRLSRDEEWFIKFKKLFIENKINFYVKNPTLVLLNPDGSVNEGTELALSLFSTMSAQEMKERKEKFKRTKRAYAKQGKWSGGRTLKFGYKVDENKFFVEDENDGAIVKLIFQLYSTGEYSTESLATELTERGLKRNDGLPINYYFVSRVINCKSYTGAPDEKNNMRVYPPLITDELFEKCREVAEGNKLQLRGGDRIVLGAKLLKCKECGATFTSNSRHFGCCKNAHNRCENNLKIRQCVVNDILWRIAFTLHLDYLMDLNEDMVNTYMEQIEVLDQKISTYESKILATDEKKKRVIETYLEGFIDKKTRDSKLSKIDQDALGYQNEIMSLNEQKEAISGLIDGIDKDLEELNLLNAIDIVEAAEKDIQAKYDIIHKHIVKVIPERMSFGKRDPRTTRDNGVLFTVYAANGGEFKYLFIPKFYQGHNLYIWNGSEWVADMVTITDNNYKRKSN